MRSTPRNRGKHIQTRTNTIQADPMIALAAKIQASRTQLSRIAGETLHLMLLQKASRSDRHSFRISSRIGDVGSSLVSRRANTEGAAITGANDGLMKDRRLHIARQT